MKSLARECVQNVDYVLLTHRFVVLCVWKKAGSFGTRATSGLLESHFNLCTDPISFTPGSKRGFRWIYTPAIESDGCLTSGGPHSAFDPITDTRVQTGLPRYPHFCSGRGRGHISVQNDLITNTRVQMSASLVLSWLPLGAMGAWLWCTDPYELTLGAKQGSLVPLDCYREMDGGHSYGALTMIKLDTRVQTDHTCEWTFMVAWGAMGAHTVHWPDNWHLRIQMGMLPGTILGSAQGATGETDMVWLTWITDTRSVKRGSNGNLQAARAKRQGPSTVHMTW